MPRVTGAHKENEDLNSPFYTSVTERGVVQRGTMAGNIYPSAVLAPRVVLRSAKAIVREPRDHLVIGPIGSRDDYITATFGGDVTLITTGCFTGSLEDFGEELAERHGWKAMEYQAALMLIRVRAEARKAERATPPIQAPY